MTTTPAKGTPRGPTVTPPASSLSQAVRYPTLRPSSPDLVGDWPSSDDDAMTQVAEHVEAMAPPPHPLPETPRKAVKTDAVASPGRRGPNSLAEGYSLGADRNYDVFWTPAPASRGRAVSTQDTAGLMSPEETPTPLRTSRLPPGLRPEPGSPTPQRNGGRQLPSATDATTTPSKAAPISNLAIASSPPADEDLSATITEELSATATGGEIVRLLSDQDVKMTPALARAIAALGTRFDLKLLVVEKGREASRDAVKRREAKIAEQGKTISGLEAQKVNLQEIVRCLRRKISEQDDGSV